MTRIPYLVGLVLLALLAASAPALANPAALLIPLGNAISAGFAAVGASSLLGGASAAAIGALVVCRMPRRRK